MARIITRVVAGIGAVGLLAVGVQLFGTTSASAHDNNVVGAAACQADGSYTVTWTISNDYAGEDDVTLNSQDPAVSKVWPKALPLTPVGTPLASQNMVQTAIPGGATSASIDVQGVWPDPKDYWKVDHTVGTVSLPGTCTPSKAPAAPDFVNGGCDNFVVTSPMVIIHAAADVSYSLDGTPRPAGSYPVPAGRHYVDATSTKFTLNPNHWEQVLTEKTGGCTTTAVPVLPQVTESSCVGHTPTAPSITLPTTPGITYTVDKGTGSNGAYQVTDTPTVRATLTAGHTFGTVGKDWTVTGNVATSVVHFQPAKDCNETVVPVSPTLAQTSCVDRAPTTPTLTWVTTPGVVYAADQKAPYAPGQSVKVTATTQPGYEFGTVPAGWTKVDSSTATTTVTFAAAENCGTATTPVTPQLTQAACAAGSTTPTAPTLTLASTPGIAYTVDKSAPYTTGERVVVTATAGKNYYLSALNSGWQLVSDTVATRTITFAAGPNACTLGVTATKASFSTQQCVSGKPTVASYTIPKTTGVAYQVNGKPTAAGTYPVTAGSTVTVVAVPQTHYVLRGQSVWKQTFGDTPQCSGNDDQTAQKPTSDVDSNTASNGGGSLADTGVPTSSLLGFGLGLLLLGGLVTVVATRRGTDGS